VTPGSTDWDIINALSAGNMAHTELARQLDVSESTVRQRVKRLQDSGILKIRALRDPNLLASLKLQFERPVSQEPRVASGDGGKVSGTQPFPPYSREAT